MKTTKLIIILLLAGIFHTYAQDIITLKSGEEIKAKVEEISSSEIKYKRFDDLKGATVTVSKDAVFFIKYENGTKEIINAIGEESSPATVSGNGYALLHIYRRNAVAALLNYDLHIGDTVICRVRNKWKETIKVDQAGLVTLWARTEAKTELPVTIELGKEYYIRCSVSMGFAVGHPKLELVDEKTGKAEFDAADGDKKK